MKVNWIRLFVMQVKQYRPRFRKTITGEHCAETFIQKRVVQWSCTPKNFHAITGDVVPLLELSVCTKLFATVTYIGILSNKYKSIAVKQEYCNFFRRSQKLIVHSTNFCTVTCNLRCILRVSVINWHSIWMEFFLIVHLEKTIYKSMKIFDKSF